MSNVLTFPPSDHALEWIDEQSEPMESDSKRNEIQAVILHVSELRARAKQGLDDAIAALEQGHARLREATQILEDHSLKMKLQSDLSLQQQLLEHAKSNLSGFWRQHI